MKYIYYNKKLRCRIKYNRWHKHFSCQLQERCFYFLWGNVDSQNSVDLSEGFWGEDWGLPMNPLRSSYALGGYNESWKTGTLNIENRVRQMFKEAMIYNFTPNN